MIEPRLLLREQIELLQWMASVSRDPGPNRFLFLATFSADILHHVGPPQTIKQPQRANLDVLVRAGLLDSERNAKGNIDYWVLPEGYAYTDERTPAPNRIAAISRWLKWRWRGVTVARIGVVIAGVAAVVAILQFLRP